VTFAHDTEVALAAATALVNTLPGPGGSGEDEDGLPDLAALDDFVREWGWTGRRARTQAELAEVRALRPVLREVWEADEDGVVEVVNRMLGEARVRPQLVRHGAWGYHLHATCPETPLGERMAVEAAMALVDVVRSEELDRLRVCAADDCGDVLVDLSKNRSRRYCSAACSNRVNVAAFRARRAGR
jgi:predicted RNA-binding Zn ribbon-like protein